jgi:hypothetical protein
MVKSLTSLSAKSKTSFKAFLLSRVDGIEIKDLVSKIIEENIIVKQISLKY